jgi:prefoldin subunit 5
LECEALALERDGLQQRVEELENRLAQINRELEEIIALLDSAASPDPADVEVPG